ncbi:MAG: hypothetical protein ABSH01_29305, partial [Terriglobia bacterium]
TTRLRSADRSAPRWLGYLLNGQLQGKLLSAYKISQAFPGTPHIQTSVWATCDSEVAQTCFSRSAACP